jgi:taurine dioxygenase
MASAITVTPLTSSIGARMTGVDLRADLTADVCAQIREAFAKYYVLVFPNDYAVGPEEQTRLAEVFGEPQLLPTFQFLGENAAATSLGTGSGITQPTRMAPKSPGESVLALQPETSGWHTDSSFTPWLNRAAVLRAETISPVGGDTSFASLCAAFDGLSATLQKWLCTLRAFHVVPAHYKSGIGIERYGEGAEERFDEAFPPRAHPMVIAHPETGRRALFINPVYTAQIEGLSRGESDALLQYLYNHIASSNYVYRHHWSEGDLVVWDEITTLHRAPTDFAPHPRKVIRVTAGRAVPTAAAQMA